MAYDAFLYFEGTPAVAGETADATYKDKKATQIYSFSWGVSNPTTVGHGSGMSGGKASFSTMNIMKRVDSSSNVLAKLCAQGNHVGKAIIVLRKSGGDNKLEYIKFEMEEVFVDSLQLSGSSGGDDYPMESVSLAYGKITLTYKQQDDKGAQQGGDMTFVWDQRTNKG